MNTVPPVKGSKRWRLERLVWIADLIRYSAFAVIGLGQINAPSPVVLATLGHVPTLITFLGFLFIAGGVWGLVVRLFRVTLFEMPAIWLCAGALTTYLSLCVWAIIIGQPAGIIGGAYSVSFLALFIRRILELHSLLSPPRTIGA